MRYLASIIVAVGMFAANTVATAQLATVEPLEVTTNSQGTEAIAQLLIERMDGTFEISVLHVTESYFSFSGTQDVPATAGFSYSIESTAPPVGPMPPQEPYSGNAGPLNRRISTGDTIANPVAIAAGACAAGWIAVRGLFSLECRNYGGVGEYQIGYCGFLGESGRTCRNDLHPPEPPDEPPEPEPEPDENLWDWYGSAFLPITFDHLQLIVEYDG